MEDSGARTPLPGQRRECRGRSIFRCIDQFWDTNTSDLLYGLQNIVCVLQVDALQSVRRVGTHIIELLSALLTGYYGRTFALTLAPFLGPASPYQGHSQWRQMIRNPNESPPFDAHFLSGGKLTNTVTTCNYIQYLHVLYGNPWRKEQKAISITLLLEPDQMVSGQFPEL